MSWNAIAMMAGQDLTAIFVSSGLTKIYIFLPNSLESGKHCNKDLFYPDFCKQPKLLFIKLGTQKFYYQILLHQ